jgi:hypothetical protein
VPDAADFAEEALAIAAVAQVAGRCTLTAKVRPSTVSKALSTLFNPLSGYRSGLQSPALRLGLSVAPPFGLECLNSFACL